MSVINGTAGADALNGTALGDQINGGAGDDVLRGFGGADTLDGGAGGDRFIWNAGDGSDRVEGGADADTVFFAGDNLVVSASGGHALAANLAETVDLHGVEAINLHGLTTAASFTVGDLSGSDVREVVIGLAAQPSANAISLTGGTSGDVIEAQVLNGTGLRVFDSVNGVVETTVISNLDSADQVTIDGGTGNDLVTVTTPSGVASRATIIVHGGEGADTVTGSAGAERLYGDAGDDVINGAGGGDTIDGGAGVDTLVVSGGGGADGVTLRAVGGHLLETVGGATTDVVNVETVSLRPTGAAGPITLGDLSSAGVKTINLDLSAAAPGQADKILLAPQAADVDVKFSSGPDGSSLQAVYSRQGAVIETVNLTGLGAGDTVTQVGGAGDDVFTTSGLSSQVPVAVDGGAGANVYSLSGTNLGDTIRLSANGSHALLKLNSFPIDLVNIQAVVITPLAGQDTVNVDDLRGTDVRAVDVDLGVAGDGFDGEADVVNMNFTTVGALKLELDTGGLADQEHQAIFQITDLGAPGSPAQSGFVGGIENHDQVHDQVNVILNSNGLDSIVGYGGNETLHFGAADDHITWDLIGNQVETDRIDGGAGQDVFLPIFRHFVAENDPHGRDQTDFSYSLLANGSHSTLRMYRAETGDVHNPDGFLIDTNFDLSHVETVVMRGGAANDTFLVFDQSGTDVQHIDIDAGGGSPDHSRDIVQYDATSGADNIVVRIAQVDLQVFANGQSMVVHSLDDTDTTIIRAGDGDDRIDLRNFYQGFEGKVVVDAGAGNDTIIGGAGPETFDFATNGLGGTDLVFGFSGVANGGHDVIQVLGGPGFDKSFAELQLHNHLVEIGGSVFLTDGAGSVMVLEGVKLGDLRADDFGF